MTDLDPEDIRAEFDRIVAGLQAEPEQPCRPTGDPAGQPASDLDVELVRDDGDDHYDPPEPPPFPVPRPRTVGGMLAVTVGVLLLVWPNLLGLGESLAVPLGLLALTAGIGWLVIGLRPDQPSDGSDGARL